MITKIYSVYDMKIKAYMQPMFRRSKGEALRELIDAVNLGDKTKSNIALHPEDFCLYELGEWDDEEGVITMHPQPESIGKAVEFVKTEEE